MLRTVLFVAALSAAAFSAPLSTARTAELRERFQKRQSTAKSWEASFAQTVSMPGMRKPVVSEGTLSYQSPGMLRLAFSEPAGDLVVATGGRVFIQKAGKRPSEKSLSDDHAGKPFASLLSLFGGKPVEEEAQYDPELSRVGGSYVLVLARKSSASRRIPARITNTFDADSLEVSEVFVELPNKGTIRYRFTDIARNRPIDPAKFAPLEK